MNPSKPTQKEKQVSPEEFNWALRRYNQPTIDFAQILLPGETIGQWIQQFKAANQGGYLLKYTKEAIRTNDYLLWEGASEAAVINQNMINIYDALQTEEEPRIVNPVAFQQALRNKNSKVQLPEKI